MKKIPFMCLVIALLVAACAPDASPDPATLTAWIDAPLHESTIPLAPYEIVVHGSDPGQISSLEISIDGEVVEVITNPDPGDLLFSLRLTWTPPAPGTYTIQARGQNSAGLWSNPALARVHVDKDFHPHAELEILPIETPSLELVKCEPQVVATTNTTCRKGPTTYNDPVVYLLEGEFAQVLGGNQDLSWWAVLPGSQKDPCWVSGRIVEVTCMPENPEILDSPPYITRVFPSHEEFYWGDNPLRTVTIQAQSGGEIPVTGVRLFYHLAGKTDWYNAAMASAGEEVWQAQISAHTFDDYNTISSTVVEYYLEAANQEGLVTRSPLFTNLILKEVP